MKLCLFGDARSVHIQRLVSALAGQRVTVHVVTHHPRELPGASVERCAVPPAGLGNLRRWHRRRLAYLRGFFRRFDVVNLQFLHDWGFTPEMLDEGCFVATAWGSDIVPPPGETPPTEALVETRRWMLCRAAVVTACGPTFARAVAAFASLDASGVEVVPFGVDTDLFRAPRTKPCGTDSGSGFGRLPPPAAETATLQRVGYFKGFRPVYGPETLIRAIPAVLERSPETHFDLVGDGPLRVDCQRLAAELGVDASISWIASQPNTQLVDLLAQWNLTVIPSVFEAFGVAALESQAMGVPVVASRVGGLQDTIRDGRTGLLVPPGDAAALADGIVRLLSDPALRRTMGEAGRAFVERGFRLEQTARRWVDTFRAALDRVAIAV